MKHLTELEEKLSKPDGLVLQRQMLAALSATALRLRQQLAASVARAEFESHTKALDAMQAAIEVLQDWPMPPDNKALNTPFHALAVHAPSLLRRDTAPNGNTEVPGSAKAPFTSPDLPPKHFFNNHSFPIPNRSSS